MHFRSNFTVIQIQHELETCNVYDITENVDSDVVYMNSSLFVYDLYSSVKH